ncbi:hypothetical protein Tco_0559773 [Tanacetum coccineum]
MQELSGASSEMQDTGALDLVIRRGEHLVLFMKKQGWFFACVLFHGMSDALSRKERVKSRRVRGMNLAVQSEAFKQENVLLVGSVMDGAHASRYLVHPGADKTYYNLGDIKEWNSGDDQLRLRWMIYLVVLADAAESVRDAIGFEYCLASSSGWTNIRCAPFEALYGRKGRSHVLRAKIGESSLTGLELVQETTDKIVLGKESPKSVLRVCQKSSSEIIALRLPEELSSVHDTFHVSNLKKYLADANLHMPLDEIKVDKTLHFVEELVEIMDREIKKLKRKKIALVKVRCNSKCGPEFPWEHEDQMRIKYPQLFMDRVVEPAS